MEGGTRDMEEEEEVIEYMDTQEDTANRTEPDLEVRFGYCPR